ncbi:MAG: DEAD/DEAH box helicase, partial [Verrucomicrobiia bacterium]
MEQAASCTQKRRWIMPEEQLLLLQLNVLNFWQNRNEETSDTPQEHTSVHEPGNEIPKKWRLTNNLELRPWQIESTDKWLKLGNGVAKVVTGAGKSILALSIIERLQATREPDLRVAIIVPSIVLLEQWYDLFVKHGNLPPHAIGRLGGGYQDSLSKGKPILIAVLTSAARTLPTMRVTQPLLLVVDECHRAGSPQMRRIFQTKRTYSLGLSATPERDDCPEDMGERDDELIDQPRITPFSETELGRELGPFFAEIHVVDALAMGLLPRFEVRHYGLPLKASEKSAYQRISREVSDALDSLKNRAPQRFARGGAIIGWARQQVSKNGPHVETARQLVASVSRRKQLLYRMQARQEALRRLVRQEFHDRPSARILIFHEAIDEVMNLFAQLRNDQFPVVVDHSQLPESLRAAAIHSFRVGQAQILVSARSLIEGFDVPTADVGIVVASSGSVRQRIQTLGRILRKSDDCNKLSILHVLYASATTDEYLYEKFDWDK